MNPPTWALTLAYWFHMLATVVWVGGLSTLGLLILPSAQRKLDEEAFMAQLEGIQGRLDILGWFSLALLTGTGLVQMTGNPNYEGLFEFNNPWSAAILLKHIVFLGMIVTSTYITWGVIPKLRRTLLYKGKLRAGGLGEDLGKIINTNRLLVYLNLSLGVIILAFTAAARALN